MEIRVTIMNGDLEKAFYGNHIFIYRQGVLQSNTCAIDHEIRLLQKQLGHVISDFVHHHPI